jgi:hypothetical protein
MRPSFREPGASATPFSAGAAWAATSNQGYYYVGSVPGPNGTTIGPATSWPTWTTAAEREQVAAIMWHAYADYWGVDRIDEHP